MEGLIIVAVGLLLFCVLRKEPFRNQRYAKGFMGVDYLGSPANIDLLGGEPPQTSDEKPSEYSLYSTKVWPTTYQPVTNTCYDEYMNACTALCSSRECAESCQVQGASICSKKIAIPKTISHTF